MPWPHVPDSFSGERRVAIGVQAAYDAVARAYPGLYLHGIRGSTLVKEFREPGCPYLRLYHVSLAFH